MPKTPSWQDQEIELRIERVAHGGIFVARHQGRVVFVSNTAPGALVLARVYEARGGNFCRAPTLKVIEPSTYRVPHFWKEAAISGAGGAEFGHLKLSFQRELKAQVLAEALNRMAKIEMPCEVDALAGDDERNGLGYRTRVQLHVSREGVAGPYRERTHEVVKVRSLPLANQEINELGVHLKNWQGVKRIEIASSATGGLQYMVDKKLKGDKKLVERSLGRSFRISQGGFWQVHNLAAETLAREVVQFSEGIDIAADNLDLYGGVGLFSGALADHFGKDLRITSVESSAVATADAQSNLVDLNSHSAVAARVDEFLAEKIRNSDSLAPATVVLILRALGQVH